MTFFERYAMLCKENGLDPCGRKMEEQIGINKTTANKWRVNNTTPKGETIRKLADYFSVSADYLLGRTEDRTDYTTASALLSEQEKKIIQLYNQLNETEKKEITDYLMFKISQKRK